MSTKTKNETVKMKRRRSTNEVLAENYFGVNKTLAGKWHASSITDEEMDTIDYYREKWMHFDQEVSIEGLERASSNVKSKAVADLITLLVKLEYTDLIEQYIGVKLCRLDYREILTTIVRLEDEAFDKGDESYA